MTAPADVVHARLQGAALDALVVLVVDHLMAQPVASLVQPDQAAAQVVRALDGATRGDEAEAWLRARITELRGQVPDGKLGDRVPVEVARPLRDVLARPFQPDRELVGRLMDHAAMRGLIKDVMRSSLTGFVDNVKALQQAVPPSVLQRGPGLGRLKALSQGMRAVSEGVVSQVGRELEHRMSSKVGEFVDEALAQSMAQVADHVCDPRNAAKWGAYRAYLLDTTLDLDNRQLVAEVDKLDPDHLVAMGAAMGRALARREGFQGEVAAMIATALDAAGDRSLRDFLAETGLDADEAEWRADLEAQIAAQARVVVATPAFRTWLDALLADDDPA